MGAYIGIDVSKATLDVALVAENRREHGQFENTPKGYAALHHYLKKRQAAQGWVCLEATGVYGEGVAEFLFEKGYAVSVVNPAQARGYAQSRLSRNKTDKVDAYLLAEFCRERHPPLWTPPPPEWRELRALVRHYDDLEQTRQQVHNRLLNASPAALVDEQLRQQRRPNKPSATCSTRIRASSSKRTCSPPSLALRT